MSIRRRLASFNDRWSLDFLTPLDLAIAGFSYIGTEDSVKCNQCNKIFLNWQRSDNPLQKHIGLSPNYPFINQVIITFDGRLKTFHNWPVLFLRPDDMAEAGFHYADRKDHVKCIECDKIFGNWKRNSNSLEEHIVRSPICPFIKMFV